MNYMCPRCHAVDPVHKCPAAMKDPFEISNATTTKCPACGQDKCRCVSSIKWPTSGGPSQLAKVTSQRDELLEALKEIEKGEGPFSRDNYTFARNVIEAMRELARAAIKKAEGRE